MTSFALGLPSTERAAFLRKLRERADVWLARFNRHDVLMARAVRGMQIEAVREFDAEVVNPLIREVAGRLALIQPASANLSNDLFPELVALRNAIEITVARGSAAVRALTEERMARITGLESSWVLESAKKVASEEFGVGVQDPAPAAQPIRSQVWLGDTTEKWFGKMLTQPTGDAARAWVTTAVKQGLTVDETVRGLVGTKTQTGVLEAPRHAVRALVRTAMTHAAAVGRQDSFKALGVTHWRFLATLDHRTSVICASEDGNVYPIGEGPIPPLHPNCRSVPSPLIGDPDADPIGTRASITGPVPARTTFEQWLEGIPKGEQDEILGRTRAIAWRAGKLSLKDMLGRDLQPLTLVELKALDRL